MRAVGREPRLGVLPVRRRGRGRSSAARAAPPLEVEQPDVGGVAVLDEDARAAVGADRRASAAARVAATASRRQCGGGFEVLARLRRARPRARPCRARSSGPSASASLLEPGERLAHERADRGQVVAALLHDDGRQAERAERAAGRAEAVARDLERALGVAGRGVDAERDDERLRRRARAPIPRARRRPRARPRRPCPAAAAGCGSRPRRVGPVSSAKPRKCGNQPGARVDVDGAVTTSARS